MKILLIGDIAFTGIISEQPNRNKERYEGLMPFLNSADLVFANLEVPVRVDHTRNEYKNFIHYSLPGPTKDLLKLLNIGCVSLANNHVYDCKMPGLEATINILDELGIYHTGAGWLSKHVEPSIIYVDGIKIAFMAYVDKRTNPKTEHYSELLINYFNLEDVISNIINIKDKVDKIIISIHWGIDYSNFYTIDQQQSARKLIEAGADIVMGHHSHTIQPYEMIDNKFIFYSLGQLSFGDFLWNDKLRALRKKTKLGMIAMVSFFNSGISYKIIPTLEKKGNYLEISKLNITKRLSLIRYLNEKKNLYKSIDYAIRIKEIIYDRFYDYFFGYYRNIFIQLLCINNIKKVYFFIRDFKRYREV